MSNPENIAVATPMGQCSITGKMVPEDELVTLHGYRVCAEGKAILLDRLKSGELLPGQMEAPSAFRRFACIFVDGLVLFVPAMLVSSMAVFVTRGSIIATAGLAIVLNVLEIVYFAQMHAARGQTLGKMGGKIKVVNLDGSPISTNTAYVRAVAYLGPALLASVLLLTQLPFLALIGSFFNVCWVLADVIVALADRTQQRALHDRLAGTRVIEIG